jgi:hypothetical protein
VVNRTMTKTKYPTGSAKTTKARTRMAALPVLTGRTTSPAKNVALSAQKIPAKSQAWMVFSSRPSMTIPTPTTTVAIALNKARRFFGVPTQGVSSAIRSKRCITPPKRGSESGEFEEFMTFPPDGSSCLEPRPDRKTSSKDGDAPDRGTPWGSKPQASSNSAAYQRYSRTDEEDR